MRKKIDVRAIYLWIDGVEPTARVRSKEQTLRCSRPEDLLKVGNVPNWGFDGSSTEQAKGSFSDCIMKPVRVFTNPILGYPHIVVLTEVYKPNGRPHPSNTRFRLRRAARIYKAEECQAGIEQEYTLYDEHGSRPYGWPENQTHYPRPQGGNYCGEGPNEVSGRELVDLHYEMALKMGLDISGVNAEVMPAQWEFQIGSPISILEAADQIWVARWLLYRLGEKLKISVKLDPKPISGDWNGAGAHTNFSTKKMREKNGYREVKRACRSLKSRCLEHIIVYGADNELRLTGLHETCSIDGFRWGVGDRGASVRIHPDVEKDRKGYLEDRRPAANMDPYLVLTAMAETICGKGFTADRYLLKRFYRLVRWMRGGQKMGLVT